MNLHRRPSPTTVALSLTILLAGVEPLAAGSYYLVFARGALSPGVDDVPPFAIMHPVGYDGSGGVLTVRVCVQPGSEVLAPFVQNAIALWSALTPTTENCENCVLWEEPVPPRDLVDVFSVLVHELGHCAMGLDHINLEEDTRAATTTRVGSCDVNDNDICGEDTSFTANFNVTRVMSAPVPPGVNVLGDSEDMHDNGCPILQNLGAPLAPASLASPATGDSAEAATACLLGLGCAGFPEACCPSCPSLCPSVPWQLGDIAYFRVADNNPFVIDATVIDKDSYSRNDVNLPAGDNYAASANRGVGELLGFPNTQSVMYSLLEGVTRYSSLVADDVNMVRMGMTGADRDAGTADDYTIQLVFEPACTTAHVRVQIGNAYIEETDLGTLGVCVATIEDSFPQPPAQRFHHTAIPDSPAETQIVVEINPRVPFDFNGILLAGFEVGDFSEWSDVVQ
jgi:hypothetical protein